MSEDDASTRVKRLRRPLWQPQHSQEKLAKLWTAVRKDPKASSEFVKNVAQVVALIVAALWAWREFRLTEAPGLESRPTIDGRVEWYQVAGQDACVANLHLDLRNEGKSSFDVSRVEIGVADFALPKGTAGKAVFLDSETLPEKEALDQKHLDQGALVGHYSPGQAAQESFAWTIEKPHGPQLLFTADVHVRGSKSPYTFWNRGQFCEPAETQTLQAHW